MNRRIVNPWTWQEEYGFVQGIEVSGAQRTLICSGQASQDADGTPLHAGDMAAQTARAMGNLVTLLEAAGFQLSDVVRLNILTTDVDRFLAEGAEVWGGRLAQAECRPATTLLGVARLAFPELLVEFEATAVA
ncbi:MAG: RidA family protein [Thermoflexaceae bacterium]|nr:RidA family protein [Thermoflexaceae bacterium]